MLSDHERKTLRELERQFMADDPTFPRSFDTRAQRMGRQRRGVPATIALVAVVLVIALMLVGGSVGGALTLAVVAAVTWLLWRRVDGTRRRST